MAFDERAQLCANTGGTAEITVLQMDFQGRCETQVAKPGLSRYRKKNVMAFDERAQLCANTGGTAENSVLFRFHTEQDFF